MTPIYGSFLVLALLLSSISNASVTPGVLLNTPKGSVVSNLDPLLNSTYNDEIYDANFLPGFNSGLTNTTVSWKSGDGYGNIQYSVGPWTYSETTNIPHLAVGPQCCNFEEVPHTQQFRRVEWGDYYYVRAGFGPPGVNVENYTAVFGGPVTDVGLRTDWDWIVQFSADWGAPTLMRPSNEWGTVGLAVTQYVPNAPGQMVYTLIELWMDSNSSSHLVQSSDGVIRNIVSSNVVVYHPVQVTGTGNQTITLDMSPYLEDTLRTLGLQNFVSKPPVIAYVYLNVEGYNFAWNTTLWSFKVMSPLNSSNSFASFLIPTGVAVAALATVVLFVALRRRSQRLVRMPPQ